MGKNGNLNDIEDTMVQALPPHGDVAAKARSVPLMLLDQKRGVRTHLQLCHSVP